MSGPIPSLKLAAVMVGSGELCIRAAVEQLAKGELIEGAKVTLPKAWREQFARTGRVKVSRQAFRKWALAEGKRALARSSA